MAKNDNDLRSNDQQDSAEVTYLDSEIEKLPPVKRYSDKSAPFIWVWDVEINPTGDVDVFLKEQAKVYVNAGSEEIKVLSMTRKAVQDFLDNNAYPTKFAHVNLEGKIANVADQLVERIRNETIEQYEKKKKRVEGLISGDILNPRYKNRVMIIAQLKALSAVYRTSINPNSIFDFHFN